MKRTRWWWKINVNPGWKHVVEDKPFLSKVCCIKTKVVYGTTYFLKVVDNTDKVCYPK